MPYKDKEIKRLWEKEYKQTQKYKEVQSSYWKSNKGKKMNKKNRYLHRPLGYLKRYYGFIMENCAICNSPNTEFHHPNNNLPLHIYFLCRKHHLEQHGVEL
jgi:hypothetical protein